MVLSSYDSEDLIRVPLPNLLPCEGNTDLGFSWIRFRTLSGETEGLRGLLLILQVTVNSQKRGKKEENRKGNIKASSSLCVTPLKLFYYRWFQLVLCQKRNENWKKPHKTALEEKHKEMSCAVIKDKLH
jgi:hypothetical protein